MNTVKTSMKKLLTIMVMSLLFTVNVYSFETFKPLSNLNLKMHNSIDQVYSSIKDQDNLNCQISFFHKGFYTTEYLNSSISENDFISLANINRKEFNIYCEDLVHKIKDANNELVDHKYNVHFDVCGGKIYSYDVVFHLGFKTHNLAFSKGFGENPEILKSWVEYFNNIVQKKPRLETKENKDPYVDIDGKIYKSFYDSRVWQHDTLDEEGKTKYLVYLSSTIYRNDKLGPVMNRVAFTIRDNTIKRLKACERF